MLYPTGNTVFYNPVQVFNRDLSILVLRQFAQERLRDRFVEAQVKKLLSGPSPAASAVDARTAAEATAATIDWGARCEEEGPRSGLRVLDALGASGLRSVRYLKEVPGIKSVLVNDIEGAAVELARRNAEYNGVEGSRFRVRHGDAIELMYSVRKDGAKRFDVIDLDPYGTAAPFIDAAVQAIADGGLLCVTCTDMRSLTGAEATSCFQRYGGLPSRAKHQHEMGLRLVLAALDNAASRYRRSLTPILSVTPDFYLRVFCKVTDTPAAAIAAPRRRALVFQSTRLPVFWVQNLAKQDDGPKQTGATLSVPAECPFTGGALRIGGPIYSAPMHDHAFCARMKQLIEGPGRSWQPQLAMAERILALLRVVADDLPNVPLHYSLAELTSAMHCTTMTIGMMELCLKQHGFAMGAAQREGTFFKTDAPPNVIVDVLRRWVELHPLSAKRLEDMEQRRDSAWQVLQKAPQLDFDMDKTKARAIDKQRKAKGARYPQNPKGGWGPKAAAAKGPKKRSRQGSEAALEAAPRSKLRATETAAAPKEAAAASGEPSVGGGKAGVEEAHKAGAPGGKKASGKPVRQLCRIFNRDLGMVCNRFAKKAGRCTAHQDATDALGPRRRVQKDGTLELHFDGEVNVSVSELNDYFVDASCVREVSESELGPEVAQLQAAAARQVRERRERSSGKPAGAAAAEATEV